MAMPTSVAEWMWWVSLVGTILMVLSFAFGAFKLKGTGCLSKVTQAMWLPLVLFAVIQGVTLLGTKFQGDRTLTEEQKTQIEAAKALLATQREACDGNEACLTRINNIVACEGEMACLDALDAEEETGGDGDEVEA